MRKGAGTSPIEISLTANYCANTPGYWYRHRRLDHNIPLPEERSPQDGLAALHDARCAFISILYIYLHRHASPCILGTVVTVAGLDLIRCLDAYTQAACATTPLAISACDSGLLSLW